LKISLVRSGGVLGVRLSTVIDTEELDPAGARELERLVGAADLAHLSEPTLSVHGQPDRFCYTLTVEERDHRRSVTFDEQRTPESLRHLVEAVWRQGNRGPGTVTA